MRLDEAAVQQWVTKAVAEKGCVGDDAIHAADALRGALQRIYKAVAFDVDGTLTVPASSRLDPDAALLVARLLRRGCHVWLVTGRGREGARRVLKEITELTDLDDDEMLRLRCVTHNGGLVHETDPVRPHAKFEVLDELLTPFDTAPFFEILEPFRRELNQTLNEAGIVPSSATVEPSNFRSAFGMRLLFEAREADRDAAQRSLRSLVDRYSDLEMRTGIYGDDTFTIDLTSGDKAEGLAALAKRFDIEPDAVLRVGDQGGEDGNDQTLLDTAAGFSVDALSESPRGCFPVVGPDGAILRGVDATRHLVESVSIGAPLRKLVNPDDYYKTFLPRLLDFERGAVARSANETTMIERSLSVRIAQLVSHDPGDGDLPVTVQDLFDARSGGVRIREWDLAELRKHARVKELFQFDALDRKSGADNGPGRCMYTDSAILLRGPDYYPNLTGRRSAEDVQDYLQLASALTTDALAALEEMRELTPTLALVRVALAIMDNIRNIVLQVLNVALFNAQPPCDEDDRVSASDRHLVATVGEIAQDHVKAYVDLLLEQHTTWSRTLEVCRQPLASLAEWLDQNAAELDARVRYRAGRPGWTTGDKKDVLRWREADDVVQNISAVVMGLRALARRPEELNGPVLAVGLQYGGLELPLLAAALAPRFGLEMKPAAMRVSMYSDVGKGDEARKDLDGWVAAAKDDQFPVMPLYSAHDDDDDDACSSGCTSFAGSWAPEVQHQAVVVFDDSCTTGTTVQAARDMLIRRGCDVRAVVVVRFPGANRAQHMKLESHGHLDTDLAQNFVHGLVGPSPYSRLVVEHPDKEHVYEDENGIFDKAKLRIRLLLHKNSPHRYRMPEAHPWGDA